MWERWSFALMVKSKKKMYDTSHLEPERPEQVGHGDYLLTNFHCCTVVVTFSLTNNVPDNRVSSEK